MAKPGLSCGSRAKDEYRRACAYGRDWWYVGVKVKASRAGITLGSGVSMGVEFDPQCDRLHLTEIAFDLASEAVAEAQQKLRTLCGCH